MRPSHLIERMLSGGVVRSAFGHDLSLGVQTHSKL